MNHSGPIPRASARALRVIVEQLGSLLEMDRHAAAFEPQSGRIVWECFACGCESSDLDYLDKPCPGCAREHGWTLRARESLRARRLYMLREAGRLTPLQCATLFRVVLARRWKPWGGEP